MVTKTHYIGWSVFHHVKLEKRITNHRPVFHGGLFSVKKPNSKILDFSSNISPTGPPKLVRKTLKKNVKLLEIYPDSNSIQLRKNLEWYTKMPYSQIVAGNGATEIIYNFCQAFLSKIPVLIPVPTFGEYEAAAKLNGCKVSYFKTMNLNESLNEFLDKIPRKGCVFVCNPNNPTGVLVERKNMLKIVKAANAKQTQVFVDECFIELVPDKTESLVKDIKKYENLFILRSLTKSFSLAGIRVGYGLGSKKTITILNKIKIPWNVSGLAQQAAGAALCHSFHLVKARNLIKKESRFLRKEISKLKGFECYDTSTNFILIKTKTKSKTIRKKLLKKNILVRDCSSFQGLNNNYIRIAVKIRKENVQLIKAFGKLK